MADQKTTNTELVRRAYDTLYVKGDAEGIAEFVRDDFIDHNPIAPSGKQAAMEFLRNSPLPSATAEVKRILADEQYVMVHAHLKFGDGETGQAVVDIWRIEDGLIAEHWDVVQPVPEMAPGHVGMF